MQHKPTIIHIYPQDGGIFDYAKVIDAVYRLKGFEVKEFAADEVNASTLEAISKIDNIVYHIELGVNDYRLFWLSWKLAKSAHNKVVVTIHDPGTVVYNLSGIVIPEGSGKVKHFLYKAARKVLNSITRSFVMPAWKKRNITRIYLNKRDAHDGHYLPHPTYVKELIQRHVHGKGSDLTSIGFSGYWGKWKGIDNLIDACSDIVDKNKLKLVIAGKTVDANDPYQQHIEERAKLNSFIELPGFIAPQDFTTFLEGLDLLVLPYHLEIPGGVSGMAQRITELGLPIVATRTPALLGQIGEENAIFVEPADTESLRQGIVEYLTNRKVYDARAAKLQKDLYQSNGWEEVGRLLTNIIEGVSSK